MFEIILNAHDALSMLSHERGMKTHSSHAFSTHPYSEVKETAQLGDKDELTSGFVKPIVLKFLIIMALTFPMTPVEQNWDGMLSTTTH